MPLETVISFFLITAIATAIPGPTMLFIASCGLTHDNKAYLGAAAGVLVADSIYFILTVSGLGAILITSHELFLALKWLGVAYLIYLGLKLIVANYKVDIKLNSLSSHENIFRDTFMKGFFVHIANPKTILFFSALLPQFIDTQKPLMIQFVIIGSVLVFTQAGVSIIYGALANRLRVSLNNSYLGLKPNIIAGFLIVLAGLCLATLRRA
ncbi:MAG: LysE family translocator [Thiohalomonadales bacterium]